MSVKHDEYDKLRKSLIEQDVPCKTCLMNACACVRLSISVASRFGTHRRNSQEPIRDFPSPTQLCAADRYLLPVPLSISPSASATVRSIRAKRCISERRRRTFIAELISSYMQNDTVAAGPFVIVYKFCRTSTILLRFFRIQFGERRTTSEWRAFVIQYLRCPNKCLSNLFVARFFFLHFTFRARRPKRANGNGERRARNAQINGWHLKCDTVECL